MNSKWDAVLENAERVVKLSKENNNKEKILTRN
jgi:hypothetical protein